MAKKSNDEQTHQQEEIKTNLGGKPEVRLDDQMSDILLVMDKMELILKAIKSIDENGKAKTVDVNEKNENSFLKFDRHSSIIENFINNFWSQLKNPTRFSLFKLGFIDYKQNKAAIQDLAEGKNTDAVKEFLKKYEIRPKGADKSINNTKNEESMAKKETQTPATATEQKPTTEQKPNRFNESLIDWNTIKNFGLSKEFLQEKGLLDSLLKGYKTGSLVPVDMNFGSVILKTDARLSLQQGQGGKVVLAVHGVRKEPDLEKAFFGHIFTDDDKKNLRESGNMGRVVELNGRNGERIPSFVSIDKLTNEVVALRADRAYIPEKISGVKLDANEIAQLKEGKSIFIEGMVSQKTGKEFNAHIQISADRKGVEYIFDNDRLFNAQKIGGVELSPKQVEALNDGKAILVEGIETKAGNTIDRFVKLDEATGRTNYFQFNPDSPEGARELIIPKELGGVQLTPEDRAELREGKAIFLKDMTSRDGSQYDSFIKLNQDTGRVLYSRTPDGFEERPAPTIPAELMGVLLSAPQRAALQEGKATFVQGIIGYDGNKIDQYAKVNPNTGMVNLYNENPDKVKNAEQRNVVKEKNEQKEKKATGQKNTTPKAAKAPAKKSKGQSI